MIKSFYIHKTDFAFNDKISSFYFEPYKFINFQPPVVAAALVYCHNFASVAVMLATVEEDLQCLEIGLTVLSCWLTPACRILRFDTSITEAPNKPTILAEFGIKVCFPTWFDIKSNNSITDGPRNFFKLMKRIVRFPHKQVRGSSIKVI